MTIFSKTRKVDVRTQVHEILSGKGVEYKVVMEGVDVVEVEYDEIRLTLQEIATLTTLLTNNGLTKR